MGMNVVLSFQRGCSDDERLNWYRLSDNLEHWMHQHVGARGSDWDWAYLGALRWEVRFQDPNKAMLFKLTWT